MRFPIYRDYVGQTQHARTRLIASEDRLFVKEVGIACASERQVSWETDESSEISDGDITRINLRLVEKPWSKEKCN